MNPVRLLKLESLLTEHLSKMIVLGEIKDPRVSSFLSVSSVRLSQDLGFCKVFISSFENQAVVVSGVDALNHASGFIHEKLKKRLSVKQVPRLQFVEDRSIVESILLNKKIDEINGNS